MFTPRTVVGALAFVFAFFGMGGAKAAWGQAPVANMEIAGFYTGAAIDPGTTDLGIHCDDCMGEVVFPFPVRFYGVDYLSAWVSSNGNLQFEGMSPSYEDATLPTRAMQTAIFPFWDDLLLTGVGEGVFTSTTGVAPNRVFNVEWRAHYFNSAGTTNFEVRFFENSRNFEIVYGVYDAYPSQTYEVGVQWKRGELSRYAAHNNVPWVPGTRIVFSETYTGSSTGSFVPAGGFPTGTTDIGNHCDDCFTHIELPFPVRFYGTEYLDGFVNSNGYLQFAGVNIEYQNTCLPVPGFGPTIFAHWDDLRTDQPGNGIFTRVSGVAPQRTFDIEWRAAYFGGGGALNCTLRLYEGLDLFERYYITSDQHGAGATFGSQAGDERYEQDWCNTNNSANPGQMYTHALPPLQVRSRGSYIAPGQVDIGNHCDDCTTAIALPFIVNLFGEEYTSVTASSNGTLQFQSDNAAYFNECLPNAGFGTTIFAYWDDLRTDTANSSISTVQFFGESPNRSMGIEWRATSFSGGQPVHFQVVLYERTPRIQLNYDAMADGGAGATIGVQHGAGPEMLQYSCNAAGRLPASLNILCLPPACELAITSQPTDVPVCGATDAVFTVGVQGAGDLTGRWEWEAVPGEGWVILAEGINTDASGRVVDVSGAHQDSLTVHSGSAYGRFRLTVYSNCGITPPVTTEAARLIVNSQDFDGDGDFGTDADIEAFFRCLGGQCCDTCGSSDFNADGDFGTDADIESFFRVLAGGNC